MTDLILNEHQILNVSNFHDLLNIPFQGEINAICWKRKLLGNFSEIVNQVNFEDNMTELNKEELCDLTLSEQGNRAREILLSDLKILKAHGASPLLNIIKCYERDDSFTFLPTDVYSFHVDRSPVATDTYLCTYHGESSEIIPNSQATQKVLIPEIREELKQIYKGKEAGFESFLSANFFDLHYAAKPDAHPISLGIGNLWRLAIEHPTSAVLPCIHRAPKEKNGQKRLLLIC
jgi:hypothetical protein